MKIAVIASSAETLANFQDVLETEAGKDQYVFVVRHTPKLSLDGIDLASTNVVIIDADEADLKELGPIAASTRNSTNPAFIFAMKETSSSELLALMHVGVSEMVRVPLDLSELREAIERIRARRYIATTAAPRGRILTFVSCKGGAGTTFLATNLAYALATEHNKKVLYIDLHLQYGDAVFYLTESAGKNSFADIIAQAGLDSTVVASGSMQIAKNLYLLQAPDTIEKTSGIKPQQVDNLLSVAVQDYDFVVIDIGETFDGVTMKALDRSERIYAVTQPILPYVRAMSKFLHIFTLLGYPAQKVKVVLNRVSRDSHLTQAKIEEAIQKPCDWIVANDYKNTIESANAGVPILKLAPDSAVSRNLLQLAAELSGKASEVKSSFFSKLFS